MITEELKPCPFCGGEANIKLAKRDCVGVVIWCKCKRCYAESTGYAPTLDNSDLALDNIESCKSKAIGAWNRRTNA